MTDKQQLVFDGTRIEFEYGDSVLIALLRCGTRPAAGGCLCLGGDCPHCLATINGVAYTRTCQVRALPGMIVERHPQDGLPHLKPANLHAPAVEARHEHCDVAVIGMGESGRAAAADATARGKRVTTLDANDGQHVVGIYPGPLVVARTPDGMVHVHPSEEIVVATGASELQPVAEGDQLAGLYTARAIEQLWAAGVALGHVVAIGAPPRDVACEIAQGELLRFEGVDRVRAVVVTDGDGAEHRSVCDSVSIGLGLQPRNVLARMGAGLGVRTVGDATRESDLPPCPRNGTVCPCSAVKVADLESVWDRGFQELELVKRATLAGTGPCQGAVCVPHIRSFLANKGGTLQPAFTARPVAWQLTMGEVSAGAHHHPTARTALDHEHRHAGAHMERAAGWWRPWNYGDVLQEYWAVREAVSVCDISTLGKFILTGPDSLELLQRLYPTNVATLKAGRSRYVLLLNERGYVLDDGMICRDGDSSFFLTFTSAGSTHAELWIRDWAESWSLDVRLMNQTMALGAINVTGPFATRLLAAAGCTDPPRYLEHKMATVAGVACRVCRLSFTGEVSYELHHGAGESVALWRALLELGRQFGIKPHGLEALMKLRLDKGHIVVGQDSDFDSTPRRLHHEWAVKLDKPDFVGKDALLRTNKVGIDRQLVGLEAEGGAPAEGAVLWRGDEYAGYVTSSSWSPALGKSVMLAWLRLADGKVPETVTVNGKPAHRVPTPFYDPEGHRARA